MNRIDGQAHKQVADLLSAYIDGQVSSGERALVERHLAACPVCTHDVATLRLTVRMLRQLPVVAAPRAFTLSQTKVAPARTGVWRWVLGAPGLATGLAAFLCVVAVGGLILLGRLAPRGSVIPVAMAPAPAVWVTLQAPTQVARQATTVQADIVQPPAAVGATVDGGIPTRAPDAVSAPPLPAEKSSVPADDFAAADSQAFTEPAVTEAAEAPAVVDEPVAMPTVAAATPTMTAVPTVDTASEAQAVPVDEGAAGGAPPKEDAGAIARETAPATVAARVAPSATSTAISTRPPAPTAEAALALESAAEAPVDTVRAPEVPPTMAPEIAPTATATATETETATPVPAASPAAPAVAREAVPAEEPPPPAPASAPVTEAPDTTVVPGEAEQAESMRQAPPESTATPVMTVTLIAVEELQLAIEPGAIHVSGRLPLLEGQPIHADLWREEQPVEWANPETQGATVQPEGRFEIELQALPGIADFDLFNVAPAHYEIRIRPVEPPAPVEARIPFDTFPPPQQ